MKLCKICESPSHAKGFCKKHYRSVVLAKSNCRICIPNLDSKYICYMHQSRIKRHGDPTVKLKTGPKPEKCFCCGRKHRTRGLCGACYGMFRYYLGMKKERILDLTRVQMAKRFEAFITKRMALFQMKKMRLENGLLF